MNQKNVRTKRYIGRNDRFADLCNYYLFHGEPVIQPESLVEKDVTELGIPFTEKGSRTIEKIRDLLRACAIKSADGVTYLIIGIENQSDIHYAMVVRNMVQDALNYAAQVEAATTRHKIKQLIQEKKKDGVYLEKETFEVLNECLNVRMEQSEQEGELREMCKAMEDWAAEERAEGRAEGEERLGKLICVLLSQNKVEEVKKAAEDEGVRKEYYTLYNI